MKNDTVCTLLRGCAHVMWCSALDVIGEAGAGLTLFGVAAESEARRSVAASKAPPPASEALNHSLADKGG
eukprot:864210-Amphidinium_carterae.1